MKAKACLHLELDDCQPCRPVLRCEGWYGSRFGGDLARRVVEVAQPCSEEGLIHY